MLQDREQVIITLNAQIFKLIHYYIVDKVRLTRFKG